MESKIEKLKKWLDEKPANWWGTSKTMSHIWGKVCMLVAEEQAESHPATLEPLAVLAVQKGAIGIMTEPLDPQGWSIYIELQRGEKTFVGRNYEDCEQLARTWLEEQKEGKA